MKTDRIMRKFTVVVLIVDASRCCVRMIETSVIFQSEEVEAVVLEKINATLEKYMGINDEELGKCTVYLLSNC